MKLTIFAVTLILGMFGLYKLNESKKMHDLVYFCHDDMQFMLVKTQQCNKGHNKFGKEITYCSDEQVLHTVLTKNNTIAKCDNPSGFKDFH